MFQMSEFSAELPQVWYFLPQLVELLPVERKM
jgi:hypothetical protein